MNLVSLILPIRLTQPLLEDNNNIIDNNINENNKHEMNDYKFKLIKK